jgi:hypothetical protein
MTAFKKCHTILILLFIAAICNQSAFAQLLEMLPYSSHYQGSTFYERTTNSGAFYGRIDFAVYDTQDYPNEFIGSDGFTHPGTGRYIYAYQIFNDLEDSDDTIAYFAVFGEDTQYVLDVDATSIGAQNDSPDNPSQSGVQPSSSSFNDSHTKGMWVFTNGFISKDEHSWFLVYSSDRDWVVGAYELKTPEEISDEFPIPPVIAEPGTLAVFAAGAGLLARKKRSR